MFDSVLVFVFITLIVFYSVHKFVNSNKNVPPGPKGWPFIGMLFELDLPTLYLKLNNWTAKYGEIFQFELLGKKFVSLNSSEILKEAFNQEPNATITAARSPTFYGKYILDNYSDIAFASPNQDWTRRRKLGHQVLRAYGEGLSCVESQIKRNLFSVKEYIRFNENKNLDPSEIVEEFVLNTVEVLVGFHMFFFYYLKMIFCKLMTLTLSSTRWSSKQVILHFQNEW